MFDTILTRRVLEPDHLHWAVGRRLATLGFFTGGEDAWRTLRIVAEEEARKTSPHQEVTLAEIYQKIAEHTGWERDVIKKTIQVEIEEELQSVVPVASSGVMLNNIEFDQPNILITDTYFGQEILRPLIEKCGYVNATVFSSADIRLTKRDGHLYGHVATSLEAPRGRIEHMGDNRRSDVVKARAAGFSAVHFKDTKPTRYEAILWSRGRGGYLGSVCAGAARVARLSYEPRDAAGAALVRVGTAVAGPLLTAFVLWVLMSARAAGLQRLYFLARDGQVLVRVADLIQARFPFGIACTYMMASRQALYLPSLPSSAPGAIESAFSNPGSKSAGQLLSELEYPADEQTKLLALASVGADERDRGALDRLEATLLRFPEPMERRLAERKLALSQYLSEISFDVSGRVGKIAIVDLGWQGNLQRRLESLLGEDGHNLFGFYLDLLSTPPSLAGRVACFAHGEDLNANILETFCLADHGSVRGFRLDAANQAECVYEAAPHDGPVSWDVKDQQDAICRYAAALLAAVDPLQYDPEGVLDSLRPAALASLRLFSGRPDPDEAEAYGSVRHAPDQTHTQLAEVAPKLGPIAFLRMMTSRATTNGETRWRRGIVARTLPRGLVDLAIRAEGRVKSLRHIAARLGR